MPGLHCEIVFPGQLNTQAELVYAAALSHDGVEPLSEQSEALISVDPTPDVLHCWVREEDRLVGYGNVDCRRIPTIELGVHPTWRRQGWGEKMLRALLGAAEQIGPKSEAVEEMESATVARVDVRPMVWAHGDLPEARALAEKLGLERTRELLRMSCPSDDLVISLPEVDPGIQILTLEEADARWGAEALDAEIVRVNNAAFSWHPEQSGWTVADVQSHREEPWFDPAECFVALDKRETSAAPAEGAHSTEGGELPLLLGFSWTKMHGVSAENPAGESGELYLVGVAPSAQGKHLGTVLTSLALRRLAARGVPELILYVEGDNEPALKVYQRNGFSIARCDVAYRWDGANATLL